MLKATGALHEIGIRCCQIFVSRVSRIVANEPSYALAPDCPAQTMTKVAIRLEKRKKKFPCTFGQKLWEEFTHDVREMSSSIVS
jgi:hypothetical protein